MHPLSNKVIGIKWIPGIIHLQKKELCFNIRNNWTIRDCDIDLYISQGYDFFTKGSIHPLRRGGAHNHITPLYIDLTLNSLPLQINVNQEYDVIEKRLLHSSFIASFSADKIRADFGYLFQHKSVQQERKLLSNIPHFLLLNLALPIKNCVLLTYSGLFYSEKGGHFGGFTDTKPLLHSIRLEYSGHCWGFYIGYEEKKYREFGNNKRERTFSLSLKLDSLGSFAKKFRKPEIIRD